MHVPAHPLTYLPCPPACLQVIPYLTVYAVLPSSLLFLFAYSWGTQRFRWVWVRVRSNGRVCVVGWF